MKLELLKAWADKRKIIRKNPQRLRVLSAPSLTIERRGVFGTPTYSRRPSRD
jgi:hypothetical protein